jgi:hypothetical protein
MATFLIGAYLWVKGLMSGGECRGRVKRDKGSKEGERESVWDVWGDEGRVGSREGKMGEKGSGLWLGFFM